MSEYVYAGLTSQTIDIFLQDSSSATGDGLAGLVYNSAGLVASYRKGATGPRAALSLATQTVGEVWSSGGFVEIDATNMPGIYRLDIPNTIVDTEGFVTLYFHGATNLLATALRVDCRALPVDVKKLLGTAWLTPAIAGTPDVNAKQWNGLSTVALPLVPTTAGRTLNVSASGEGDAVLNAETLNSIRSGLATSSQVAAITSQAINTVTRSVDDTNPLTFNWPVSGATITATRSINNAAYGAVAGAIAFLRTEGTKHYYTLAHNAADRPTAEGTVRYKFDDGTYTRYVVMAVATAGLGDDTLAQLQSIEDSVDANTGYLTTVLDRIPAALFAGVTSMGDWLRRVFRKDAGTAGMIAAEGEINTGGTSTFDGETDNLERIYEVAGTGGGGGGATATEIADAILVRDWTAVSGSVPSRSVLNALRHIRNKWALDGTTKTVYAEDGTTPAFTTTVTADGAGNITADTPND